MYKCFPELLKQGSRKHGKKQAISTALLIYSDEKQLAVYTMHTFRFFSLWETLPAVSVPSLVVASLSLPELCFAASLLPFGSSLAGDLLPPGHSPLVTQTRISPTPSVHILLLAYLCCLKPRSTSLLSVPLSVTESCSCLARICVERFHISSLSWAKLSL